MSKTRRATGTREWSSHSVNCLTGCEHNCRYCYARASAIRWGRVGVGEWSRSTVQWKNVNRRRGKLDGVVMFPTTHDITPAFLEPCMEVLTRLLAAGNDVLLVSKPHLECIKRIEADCRAWKDRLLFRFTIGSMNHRMLEYWEPGAPGFPERLACLELAQDAGYKTSVSAEPCLTVREAPALADALLPFISDALWIGKMNDIGRRVKVETAEDRLMVAHVERGQVDAVVWSVYNRLKDNPQVKWKDSIKKVVGIEPGDVGEDV